MQRLAFLFATAFAFVLAACSQDVSLRHAPPPDPEDTLGGSTGNTGDFGGGFESPWANLDPGDIPDDLFAVGWVDLNNGCMNCTYGPNSPNRYDLVDALGRSVGSFDLPFPWDDQWWYWPELLGIHASGPGRFLVANLVYTDGGNEQIVWEADGFAGTSTILARLRSDGLELPLAGVTIPLPTDSWIADEVILPDPTDAGRLLVVPHSTSPYLPNELRQIWSVSTTDPEAPITTWSIRDLLPDELVPAGWDALEAPWHVSLAADGSGRLILGMIGIATASDAGSKTVTYTPRPVLVGVDLDDPSGDRWVVDAAELTVGAQLLAVPPSPGQPGALLWTPQLCGQNVALWQDGAIAELELPASDQCPKPGTLIDAPSGTFLYTAGIEQEGVMYGQRLVVVAGGEEVWQLDRFGVGLSQRPFHVLGMAHVPAE